MKIALAQLNYHVGNFESNKRKMLQAIEDAKAEAADIVCFAELASTGYPPQDYLQFEDFLQKSDELVDIIAEAARGIAVIMGAPVKDNDAEVPALYNGGLFLHEGKRLHIAHKALLPNYDIFNDPRYFKVGKNQTVFRFKDWNIAILIGDDCQNPDGKNPHYSRNPLQEIKEEDPDFIINIAASPFDTERAQKRIDVLSAGALKYDVPIFYLNHVGAHGSLIFDGGSMVINQKGIVCRETTYFEEAVEVFDLEEIKNQELSDIREKNKIALIQDALIVGIQEYFDKLGFSQAILGLSGGLDSAVTAVLAAKALGASNVKAIMMPSRFSSDHSINDSLELIDNLGIKSETIAIHKPYDVFLNLLQPHFQQRPFDTTEENLQARIRGISLMAFSNKLGYILLNTTNKSEMAVGYGTLYGDLAGAMSVLADVYKSDVYALARHLNKNEKLIPENIITKPPSAELRPDQKDSDSLPSYDILDRILYLYIEEQLSFAEIVGEGFDDRLVKRIIRLVNLNEFKRFQTAPVLRVSTRAFDGGRQMPIVSKYLL